MKFLVTGGAGFIGSHLTERLLGKGHGVIIIDDLSTGRKDNLRAVANHPQLTVHYQTMEDRDLLKKCVNQVDFVYHLAAAVGVKKIIDDPIDSLGRNVKLTELILEAVAPKKLPCMLASTSEVYGKSTRPKFKESDDLVLGPTYIARWSYACAKAIDEYLGLAYHKKHGIPLFITRFFNTVGPRQSHEYGMVIPRFVNQALKGEDLTIFGDGSQSRCFCHVSDVVGAIVQLMNERVRADGQVFNIGSSEEVTIKDLASRILTLTGSKAKIRYIPYQDVYNNQGTFEDIQRRCPDLSKAVELINYKVAHTLDDILRSVVDEMRKSQDPRTATAA